MVEKVVASTPAAKSLSHRPAVSLDTHRKSGNEIEEGNETKHGLDQVYTKYTHSEVKSCVSLRKAQNNPYSFNFVEMATKTSRLLLCILRGSERERFEYKSGLILMSITQQKVFRSVNKVHQYIEQLARKQRHHRDSINALMNSLSLQVFRICALTERYYNTFHTDRMFILSNRYRVMSQK